MKTILGLEKADAGGAILCRSRLFLKYQNEPLYRATSVMSLNFTALYDGMVFAAVC